MFIYVFSEQDKMKLLSEGYVLLKEDTANGMYVFAIDNGTAQGERFSGLGTYCFSDVLTF